MLISVHASAFVFKMKVQSLLTKPRHDIPNPLQKNHFKIYAICGGTIKMVQD